MTRSKARSTPRDEAPPDSVIVPVGKDDPKESRKARNQLHGPLFAGMVYAQQTKPLLSSIHGEKEERLRDLTMATTCLHALSLRNQMEPRDALEGMLIDQALWTHARIARLTQLSALATTLDHIRFLSEATDRATNTYRRIMLALAEYRRPPRMGDHYTAIQQANIAGQQVVQNSRPTENATNEKGFSPDATATAPQETSRLPTIRSGVGFTPAVDPAGETLAVHARPRNNSGKSSD